MEITWFSPPASCYQQMLHFFHPFVFSPPRHKYKSSFLNNYKPGNLQRLIYQNNRLDCSENFAGMFQQKKYLHKLLAGPDVTVVGLVLFSDDG